MRSWGKCGPAASALLRPAFVLPSFVTSREIASSERRERSRSILIDLAMIGDFPAASGIEKIARCAVVQRVHNACRCPADGLQALSHFRPCGLLNGQTAIDHQAGPPVRQSFHEPVGRVVPRDFTRHIREAWRGGAFFITDCPRHRAPFLIGSLNCHNALLC
jgi:hypothetical protein